MFCRSVLWGILRRSLGLGLDLEDVASRLVMLAAEASTVGRSVKRRFNFFSSNKPVRCFSETPIRNDEICFYRDGRFSGCLCYFRFFILPAFSPIDGNFSLRAALPPSAVGSISPLLLPTSQVKPPTTFGSARSCSPQVWVWVWVLV